MPNSGISHAKCAVCSFSHAWTSQFCDDNSIYNTSHPALLTFRRFGWSENDGYDGVHSVIIHFWKTEENAIIYLNSEHQRIWIISRTIYLRHFRRSSNQILKYPFCGWHWLPHLPQSRHNFNAFDRRICSILATEKKIQSNRANEIFDARKWRQFGIRRAIGNLTAVKQCEHIIKSIRRRNPIFFNSHVHKSST